jgi:hypothetical protein
MLLMIARFAFRQAAAKMALDLFCFSPFVNILFLLCIPLLEGRTLAVAARNVTAAIIEVQKAALKFWMLAHAVNYSLVPARCTRAPLSLNNIPIKCSDKSRQGPACGCDLGAQD